MHACMHTCMHKNHIIHMSSLIYIYMCARVAETSAYLPKNHKNKYQQHSETKIQNQNHLAHATKTSYQARTRGSVNELLALLQLVKYPKRKKRSISWLVNLSAKASLHKPLQKPCSSAEQSCNPLPINVHVLSCSL